MRLVLAFLVSSGVGCAPVAVIPDTLPGVFEGLDGFDPLEPEPSHARGDAVLYRIDSRQGKTRLRWFVRIELEDPRETGRGSARVTLTRHGVEPRIITVPLTLQRARVTVIESGTEEEATTALWIPHECFEHTLFDLAQGPDPSELPDEELATLMAVSLNSTTSLFDTASEDETLSSMMRRAVGRPSWGTLWTAFWSSESELSLELNGMAFEETTLTFPEPLGERAAVRTPAQIYFGEDVLMNLELTYIESRPPLHPGMGIARIRGVNPSDPERWIEIELIGARRGFGSQ